MSRPVQETESRPPESIVRMVARWMDDERLLAVLFGPYSENDYSDGAEMQRNLSTAIAYGNGFLNSANSKAKGNQS